MDLQKLEGEIAEIVTNIYLSPDLIHYPYHNLVHTQRVVEYQKRIAANYLLNEKERFILTAAAWFHDIGQLYGAMEGHEERSALIMKHYLEGDVCKLVPAIEQCILATKPSATPSGLSEQIIRDADTYHLGTSLFKVTDPLVQEEMEMRTGRIFSNEEWHQKSIELLSEHKFHTKYCRDLLDNGKRENIAWLRAQIERRPFPNKGSDVWPS